MSSATARVENSLALSPRLRWQAAAASYRSFVVTACSSASQSMASLFPTPAGR